MTCPDCNVPMDRQEDFAVTPGRVRPLRLVDVAYLCPDCSEIFHWRAERLVREELPVDVAMARR